MHSLIPHISPAMTALLLLILAAMMPGGDEARCSLKKLDGDLKKILAYPMN